jgi:hypothetical protein
MPAPIKGIAFPKLTNHALLPSFNIICSEVFFIVSFAPISIISSVPSLPAMKAPLEITC